MIENSSIYITFTDVVEGNVGTLNSVTRSQQKRISSPDAISLGIDGFQTTNFEDLLAEHITELLSTTSMIESEGENVVDEDNEIREHGSDRTNQVDVAETIVPQSTKSTPKWVLVLVSAGILLFFSCIIICLCASDWRLKKSRERRIQKEKQYEKCQITTDEYEESVVETDYAGIRRTESDVDLTSYSGVDRRHSFSGYYSNDIESRFWDPERSTERMKMLKLL